MITSPCAVRCGRCGSQDLAAECGEAMDALHMPAPVPLSDRGREPLTRLVAAAQREAHAHIPLTPSLRVRPLRLPLPPLPEL